MQAASNSLNGPNVVTLPPPPLLQAASNSPNSTTAVKQVPANTTSTNKRPKTLSEARAEGAIRKAKEIYRGKDGSYVTKLEAELAQRTAEADAAFAAEAAAAGLPKQASSSNSNNSSSNGSNTSNNSSSGGSNDDGSDIAQVALPGDGEEDGDTELQDAAQALVTKVGDAEWI